MEFRITSIERKRVIAATLIETLIGIGIAGIVFLAAGDLLVYTSRMFAAQYNYVDLDAQSRQALDRMTMEIRQADSLVSFTSNQLLFSSGGLTNLSYTYSPAKGTLTRTNGNQTEVLLTGCSNFGFSLYQRNPINGTFDQVPATAAPDTKLIQVTWTCARSILGNSINTETIQSAKIVIRK